MIKFEKKYYFKLLKPKYNIIKNTGYPFKLKVIDLLNKGEIIYFISIPLAARKLGLIQGSVYNYLKGNLEKPFKGRYIIKLITD